ncbi:MAG: response regulator, partial [bacterium]|nr:response regulator [bacterium]
MEKYKILIVDDEPDLKEILGCKLGLLGYETIPASHGLEALEKIKQFRPDLILLDVMMPYLNGFQLCDKLRSNTSTCLIPVILLTARDMKEDKIRGLNSGADD